MKISLAYNLFLHLTINVIDNSVLKGEIFFQLNHRNVTYDINNRFVYSFIEIFDFVTISMRNMKQVPRSQVRVTV